MKSPKMRRCSSVFVTLGQSFLKPFVSCAQIWSWNQSVSFFSTRRSEKTRLHSCTHRRRRSFAAMTVFGEPCVMPWKTFEMSRRLKV